MTRRRSIRRPARGRRSWPAGAGRPAPLRSGWNWTPSSAPRAIAETNGRAVLGRGEDERRRRRPAGIAGVRVDEIEVGARRRCRRTAGAAASRSTWFQPMCGRVGARRAGRSGRARRRGSPRRPRRCPRTGAGGRGRCRGTAGRRPARPGSARTGRARRAWPWPVPAAPTPGTISASAPRSASASRAIVTVAPTRVERLVDAHQVARPVVDDGDAGATRSLRGRPWSRPRPSGAGRCSQAARSARASALKAASAR